MINKVLTEEEMFEERLRRLDKQEYLDEKEHRFILANIKACFRETIHQRDYIKQLESKIKEYENLMGTPIQDIMKRLKVLDIIQNYAIKYDNCVCIDAIFYDEEVMEWCE